jgi:tetratricopeptide repeat protein
MAESLVGGMLGGEDERPQVEAPEAVAGAEAFAAAIAAKLAGNDPGVARKTEIFLDKQAQLLETQNKHLEEEHALRVALLRGHRLSQAFRIGFQFFLILVASVIGIGALLMIRNAIEAHDVVIEAFQVPPDLAQRGLTGEVIAKQVLDQLTDMTVVTSLHSARPANSYSSSWGNNLKVEIPETGVSFGELSRYLHEALGHESHISGEVYETPTGITVSARAGEEPARSFNGRLEDIDQLVRKAAEAIYEQTQPFRFANYLAYEGRDEEARPIVARLRHDPNPVERAWALQGARPSSLAQRAEDDRAALAALPGFLRAMEGLAGVELLLGHDAAAVAMASQCVNANPKSKETVAPAWRDFIAATCLAVKSVLEGDYPEVLRASSSLSEPDRARLNIFGLSIMSGPLRTHDLDAVISDTWSVTLAATVGSPGMKSLIANDRDLDLARVALERGDASAVQLLTKVSAFDETPATSAFPAAAVRHDYMLRVDGLWLALAKARFGDLSGGQALIAETPMDCRMCVDFRGRIAALAGNTSEAEKWFAEAIKMAPKLPQVYTDRGQARLDHGELATALTDATQAATLSPHDGDAWKLWGDVLAKQGKTKEALTKYDEALKYAPHWKQLQEARETVAKQRT